MLKLPVISLALNCLPTLMSNKPHKVELTVSALILPCHWDLGPADSSCPAWSCPRHSPHFRKSPNLIPSPHYRLFLWKCTHWWKLQKQLKRIRIFFWLTLEVNQVWKFNPNRLYFIPRSSLLPHVVGLFVTVTLGILILSVLSGLREKRK